MCGLNQRVHYERIQQIALFRSIHNRDGWRNGEWVIGHGMRVNALKHEPKHQCKIDDWRRKETHRPTNSIPIGR